ncbi:MAG: hypothetical protein HY042_01865 [Spirochaetia bacterium]|nr:hypothetical protein [Spirochaetia bacterium]
MRKPAIDDVVVLSKRPSHPVKVLGTLIVRDFSGEIDDPGFVSLLRREARKRGAEGVWITERRLHKQSIGTYSNSASTDRRQSPSYQPALTGAIETELGVVTVTLFVFESRGKDAH